MENNLKLSINDYLQVFINNEYPDAEYIQFSLTGFGVLTKDNKLHIIKYEELLPYLRLCAVKNL